MADQQPNPSNGGSRASDIPIIDDETVLTILQSGRVPQEAFGLITRILEATTDKKKVALPVSETRILAYVAQSLTMIRSQISIEAPEFCGLATKLIKASNDSTSFVITKKQIELFYVTICQGGCMDQPKTSSTCIENETRQEELSRIMKEDPALVAKLTAAQSARGCATMSAYEILRFDSMCTSLMENSCPLQDDSGLFETIRTKAVTARKANIGMALDAPEVEVFMLLRSRALIFKSVTNRINIHCIPPVGQNHPLDHRIDPGKDYSLELASNSKELSTRLAGKTEKEIEQYSETVLFCLVVMIGHLRVAANIHPDGTRLSKSESFALMMTGPKDAKDYLPGWSSTARKLKSAVTSGGITILTSMEVIDIIGAYEHIPRLKPDHLKSPVSENRKSHIDYLCSVDIKFNKATPNVRLDVPESDHLLAHLLHFETLSSLIKKHQSDELHPLTSGVKKMKDASRGATKEANFDTAEVQYFRNLFDKYPPPLSGDQDSDDQMSTARQRHPPWWVNNEGNTTNGDRGLPKSSQDIPIFSLSSDSSATTSTLVDLTKMKSRVTVGQGWTRY